MRERKIYLLTDVVLSKEKAEVMKKVAPNFGLDVKICNTGGQKYMGDNGPVLEPEDVYIKISGECYVSKGLGPFWDKTESVLKKLKTAKKIK